MVWKCEPFIQVCEDAKDNLMRVRSKKIAVELLEMTFGNRATLPLVENSHE